MNVTSWCSSGFKDKVLVHRLKQGEMGGVVVVVVGIGSDRL